MKYIVYFNLPMSCSCIVEADNTQEANDMVHGRTLETIKKHAWEFSVDDCIPANIDICEVVSTELYDEDD